MKIFKITENDSNQRLDKFLKKLLPNATRWLIYKLNRKWNIKINGKKEDNEYKLQTWDEIKIFVKDEDFIALKSTPVLKNSNIKKLLDKKDIVFEDANLLVINKNPWINVHPWDHKTKEISLIEQVHDYLWNKLNSLTFKPSLVHRIDRDTSWIVLVAKKKDVLTKLVSDFKNHKNIKKFYLAIVSGKLQKNMWKIEDKLERIENAKNENKVKISKNGQKAITNYQVIWEYFYKNENFSLLELEIETWRMHQIRVHLSNLWNPIIWDKTYGNKSLNHYLEKELSVKRQFLHAFKIEFINYQTWKIIKLEARLKDDMKEFLEKVEKFAI